MSERKIKLTHALLRGPISPSLVLVTAATAAERLGLTEKYIFELVNEGKLDRVRLMDGAGRELGVGVTLDSVERYTKRVRMTKRRQLDLLPDPT